MVWVQIYVHDTVVLAFTYVDEQAGPSAKGAVVRPESLEDDIRCAVERPNLTVRLDRSFFKMSPLPPETIVRLGLPLEPKWMSFFGGGTPQPWRNDPVLSDRFHPDYPDDLQVTFFFTNGTEAMWVRTTGVDLKIGGYEGTLLNDPSAEGTGLAQGARVAYRVAKGTPDPVWVSPVARANLDGWESECTRCGFDLLFESVEEITARQFNEKHDFFAFTTRCSMCGGTMLVKRPGAPIQ